MALNIKDPVTEQLARDLAHQTGESITTAIRRALEERLRRISGRTRRKFMLEDLADIRGRWTALRQTDKRNSDEILEYDEHGLPR